MKTSAHRERDYTFGEKMLTLRTQIGLTQAELGRHLGVSRRAVGEWEAGSSYPKSEHLKEVITLAVKQQAFPAGSEVKEIRAFWKAARQKVLLDECWLSALLNPEPSRHLHRVLKPVEETVERASLEPAKANGPRVDWDDALAVPTFYGREQEQALLTQWVLQERCRVVSVLGMGGIGKSALAVSLMHQMAEHFEVVIFRSLRDALPCEGLLDGCLQVLSPQLLSVSAASLERRLSLLLEFFRGHRVLVILDNLECLLKERDVRGHFRPGFEGYGQLLLRVAETDHQSCLLLTSREKLSILRPLSEKHSPVRSLCLSGLSVAACRWLFEERELVGTLSDQDRLIESYVGNPLALKMVAATIHDLFGGEIGMFLGVGTVVFGSITDLLDEHFVRLSALEQSILCWLAILREPVTLQELLALLVTSQPPLQVLEATDGLHRRSLIERGKRPGSFTLQSVVLEYVTSVLVAECSSEIKQGRLDRLREHGLTLAHAKEYVRQTQERLLLSPLLANLESVPQRQAQVEEQMLSLLDQSRKLTASAQGYGPTNLLALLRVLRGNLNGLDFSHLALRGAYLQGIEMHDANLSGAQIRDCVWTSTVDVAWAVALSGDGKWWASGGIQGHVRVWEGVHPYAPHLVWQAHTDFVYTLAFSPDGRTLASGGQDGTVKLWEVESGALLWTSRQSFPLSLAFSPDGHLLASGELEATVRIFDPHSGLHLQTLTPSSDVWAIAWSPDGSLLASGGVDGEIRFWARQDGTELAFRPHLSVQTNWVSSLAFSPDGRMLASTSWGDQTVRLWEVANGQLLYTLPGTDQSRGVAFSPDGRILAFSNPDKGIWLWDWEENRYRAILHGHSTDIYGMAFTPDGTRLLSGSADGTLRVWDVSDARCVHVRQGYGVYLYDLAWSPDGTHLISGDTDGLVIVWKLREERPPTVLSSHTWIVEAVGWSPDEQSCASCGLDGVLCLWNPTSHTLVHRFEDSRVLLLSMAWSPNGSLLACGTYGQGIQVWNATTRSFHFVGLHSPHPVAFWCVDWSPSGTQLVAGGSDGCLYLWECAERSGPAQDIVPLRLPGHQSRITSVAFSPNGKWLASGSGTSSHGEVFVWDIVTGERVQTLEGHPNVVYALAWSRSHGDQLISAGGDGLIRWWNVETASCIRKQEAHQGTIRSLKVSSDGKFLASCGDDGAIRIWDLTGHELLRTLRRDRPYERMNITGIRGLTEAQRISLQALGAFTEAEKV